MSESVRAGAAKPQVVIGAALVASAAFGWFLYAASREDQAATSGASSGSDQIVVPLLLMGAAALYFLPTFVSVRKRNAGAIFALNLLLGWTLLGWVVALVWALTKDPTEPAAGGQPPPP
jgi:hypothetical protein